MVIVCNPNPNPIDSLTIPYSNAVHLGGRSLATVSGVLIYCTQDSNAYSTQIRCVGGGGDVHFWRALGPCPGRVPGAYGFVFFELEASLRHVIWDRFCWISG